MPYIITTQAPDRTVWEGPRSTIVTRPPVTRTAVATLDEALNRVVGMVDSAYYATPYGRAAKMFEPIYEHVRDLAAAGDTIGPLPDGTVIEVRPTDTITCPGNEFHGPCGKPAHWRDGASLGGLYRDGAYECSDTRCWTMTTLDHA